MVHHAIDIMHVKKNVCEVLIGTLLDIPRKTKDTLKVRMYLVKMKLRKDLHHETLENGSKNLTTTCYTLRKCAIACMELKFRLVTQTMYVE
jgi:hypothetical protein